MYIRKGHIYGAFLFFPILECSTKKLPPYVQNNNGISLTILLKVQGCTTSLLHKDLLVDLFLPTLTLRTNVHSIRVFH